MVSSSPLCFYYISIYLFTVCFLRIWKHLLKDNWVWVERTRLVRLYSGWTVTVGERGLEYPGNWRNMIYSTQPSHYLVEAVSCHCTHRKSTRLHSHRAREQCDCASSKTRHNDRLWGWLTDVSTVCVPFPFKSKLWKADGCVLNVQFVCTYAQMCEKQMHRRRKAANTFNIFCKHSKNFVTPFNHLLHIFI